MEGLITVVVASTLYVQFVFGQADFTCTPQSTFAHPSDCSMYYYCDNQNIQQLFYCPVGSYFNSQTSACDLSDSSQCLPPPGIRYPSESTGQEKDLEFPTKGSQEESEEKHEISPSLLEANPPFQESSGLGDDVRYSARTIDITTGQEGDATEVYKGTTPLFTILRQVRSETETSVPSKPVEGINSQDVETTSLIPETSSPSDPESKSVSEGRCGVDSVKSFPAFPIVGVILGNKDKDGKPISVPEEEGSGDELEVDTKETKTVDETSESSTPEALVIAPKLLVENSSLSNNDSATESPVIVVPQNISTEDGTVFNIPDFSFIDKKELTPVGPFESAKDTNVESPSSENVFVKNAESSEGSLQAKEIEEAKGAIVFESHTDVDPAQKTPPEDPTKVIIDQTVVF